LLLGRSDEHAAFGQPQRHVSLLGAFGRDEVVTAIRPDLIASLEWEEPCVPSLRVHLGEDGLDGLRRFLGIER
jgi:hypothetical protein